MPSIFIWKSDTPNVSKDVIRQYIGYNWILEDSDIMSKSYKISGQTFIKGINSMDVLINNAKLMPTDWIGSELLEVIQVPYTLIKSDNYASYELIGNWKRVILNTTLDLTNELCKIEFNNILNWISTSNTTNVKQYSGKQNSSKHLNSKQNSSKQNRPIKDKQLTPEITNIQLQPYLNDIESFEKAFFEYNNITKEDLFKMMSIDMSNTCDSTYNHHNHTYNHKNNNHKNKSKYNDNTYNSVKIFDNSQITNHNIMSIPLCSI